VVLLALRPVRNDGMGAAMGKPHAATGGIGIGIAVAAALMLLPVRTGLAAVVAGLGSSLAVAGLAHRQVGGHTGDVLGAAEVFTECVVLSVAASAAGV
jgi:adenosylcobinamide-GDP ribazoletransferase